MTWFQRITSLLSSGPGAPAAPKVADSDMATPPAMPSDATDIRYSSDKPIESKEDDRFNRWPFSKRIADTLATRTDPSSVVIGLYGAWGEGKTSALRLMETALASHSHVICVRFNPWHFQTEEKLLRGFFSTLATALDRSLPTKAEQIGRLLKEYGGLLSLASTGLTGAAKDLGAALSTVELDDLRKRVEKILEEAKKRVVILIDDIDRLDRQEIQTIFKLVKLSADFNYTSYVLSFDDEMVAAALGEKYGSGGAESGRAFLEKIIQVPLHLPPADELELRSMTFRGVEEALKQADIGLTQTQTDAFVRHFVDGLEPRLKTPRLAKLYANALLFALPILKGEVNPLDQLLIEGIRVFYPNLYAFIRDNPQYMMPQDTSHSRIEEADKKKVTSALDTALDAQGIADKERVIKRLLLVLFPRLGAFVGGMGYGSDWNETWEREQRVCSSAYFDRYFSYAIPTRDVSDVFVNAFMEQVRTDADAAEKALHELAKKGALSRFIDKLRRQEDNITEPAASQLARMLARNGSVLPRERGMLLSDMTFRQAAILVKHLVRQTSVIADRENLAKQIMAQAEPLPFAFEFYRWIRHYKEDAEADRFVTDTGEEDILQVLVERIRAEAKRDPLYRTYKRDTPALFYAWKRKAADGEIEKYLREWLDRDDTEVDAFLDVYVGEAWGLESGLPHKADFSRSQYDGVAEVIDPAFIAAKLRSRYGNELDNPQYHHSSDTPVGRRIAHQFSSVRKAATEIAAAAKTDEREGEPS
jgi:hypothetical protein